VQAYSCAFAYSSFLRGDALDALLPDGELAADYWLDLIDRKVI
jgi:hypothetical protein